MNFIITTLIRHAFEYVRREIFHLQVTVTYQQTQIKNIFGRRLNSPLLKFHGICCFIPIKRYLNMKM